MPLSRGLNFGRSTKPLQLQTIDGFPSGMNVNDAPHEITDDQARYLQDVWINTVGLLPRRGPLTDVSGMVSFGTDAVIGMTEVAAPDGTIVKGVLCLETGGQMKFYALSSSFATRTQLGTGN